MIDSVTGCTVMTLPEFWRGEAEREGRPASDLMDEFYVDLDREQSDQEARLRDPEATLEFLREQWSADPESNPAGTEPVAVTRVLSAQIRSSLRTSSTQVVAHAFGMDGYERRYTAWVSYDGGTRLQPPESDGGLTIEEIAP